MPYDPSYYAPIRVDRMRRAVRAEKPDVLQVSSPFLPALVAATLRGIPVRSYVYHSDPIGCYLRPALEGVLPPNTAEKALEPAWMWMRQVCRTSDVTVVAGQWLEDILKKHGCRRVRTVPFGIDHADFGPGRFDAEVRNELLGPLAKKPEARLALIAGRLAVDKRQALLVEALHRAARERPIALVVLGDGPERERLMTAAGSLPHSTFLRFTRDRAHYAAILASADVLVHGSRAETYGFVIAETLASGTPVVVPDDGAAPHFGVDRCGEVYPRRAGAEAIAAAIERVLRRPDAELRTEAVRAAQRQPSLESHFDGLFGLYAEMRDAKRATG